MPKYRRSVRLAVAMIMIAGATALAGCAGATPSQDTSSSRTTPSASSSATPAADFNTADVMFVQMMNPHHQQAIEMSDLLLAKENVDAEVRKLAQQIKDAQAPEIEQMAGWAEDWGVSPTPAAGHDHGDDMGMMDEESMASLREADGDQATQLFLAGMIKHHEGAIVMAEEQKEAGQNPDALELADTIIATQQAEIDTMQAMLDAQ